MPVQLTVRPCHVQHHPFQTTETPTAAVAGVSTRGVEPEVPARQYTPEAMSYMASGVPDSTRSHVCFF